MQKSGNYIVNTVEKWEQLMNIFERDSEDIKWGGIELPTKVQNWNDFKERTVIILKNNVLTYGKIEDLRLDSYEL